MPKISKEEYVQLVGLLTLARKASKRITECEEAFAEIIDLEAEDSYDKGGYILQDNVWEDNNIETVIKEGLKNNNIKIRN